jgi:hypothetical protein
VPPGLEPIDLLRPFGDAIVPVGVAGANVRLRDARRAAA